MPLSHHQRHLLVIDNKLSVKCVCNRFKSVEAVGVVILHQLLRVFYTLPYRPSTISLVHIVDEELQVFSRSGRVVDLQSVVYLIGDYPYCGAIFGSHESDGILIVSAVLHRERFRLSQGIANAIVHNKAPYRQLYM